MSNDFPDSVFSSEHESQADAKAEHSGRGGSDSRRRCILPVDGFFEWKAIKGQKAKQPYAIAMKNGSPFGIGGLWENWKEFGGVIVPLLRFWCGARRYAHLTHLDCAVGVPFLWCCYR